MSEGFHIQAKAEGSAPVSKTPEEELNPREIKGEAIWEGTRVRLGKSEMGVNLAEGGLETPIDLNLAEGGEQNPDIVDLEGKHADWVARHQGEPSAEALFVAPQTAEAKQKFDAEQAALDTKLAQKQEVVLSSEQVKAEMARADAERKKIAAERAELEAVQQRLKELAAAQRGREEGARKIQEADKMGETVAQALVDRQEATNPQGTKPEDTTVN